MKLISIVTPCFNEVENVHEIYLEVKKILKKFSQKYNYEHIFIDNDSNDGTIKVLKDLAKNDKNIKLIINSRNFGHIRSPFYGLINAKGDAVILLNCDFQDPPQLILEFIKEWEKNYEVIVGIKNKSLENFFMFNIRKFYYYLIKKFSETEQIPNFTGFALYDKSFIEKLKTLNDPYPYIRGLINEFGCTHKKIFFEQPKRIKGKSKNNFLTLLDMALLGFINHTKIFLRLATLTGFLLSFLSFFIAIAYLIAKLIYWNNFNAGISPILIGLFFFSSVQLLFIGIIGEYIGAIHTHVKNKPIVIEKERINFDN